MKQATLQKTAQFFNHFTAQTELIIIFKNSIKNLCQKLKLGDKVSIILQNFLFKFHFCEHKTHFFGTKIGKIKEFIMHNSKICGKMAWMFYFHTMHIPWLNLDIKSHRPFLIQGVH